ncbi:MAG: 30S ribosomal protein S9 [Anaerolineae bacterium]|nr:30S ribosomal protein S9 [Anaerolineae bacterium]MDW8070764.1 30S ribosomal protein S9 [Anaerolineae bacterium]
MAEAEFTYYEGIGRRKTATARVRIYPGGNGTIVVNERPVEEYFTREWDIKNLSEPLVVTNNLGRFNVTVHVRGGGITGQADAIRLGLARALLKFDPENRPILRKMGMLTRDPRAKERKKPGLKRARKAPQYTKR